MLDTVKRITTRLLLGCGALAAVAYAGSAGAQVTLTLGSANNPECGEQTTLSIPLTATNLNNLSSFGVDINYDNTQADFTGYTPGPAFAAWSGNSANEITAGTIRVGGFRGQAPQITNAGDTLVGTLTFTCIGAACPSITALEMVNAILGFSGATRVNGQITCGEFPTVRIANASGACGTTIDVPVTIENFTSNVSSYGIDVLYDNTALDFTGTTPGTATAAWSGSSGNEITPGTVRLGGFRGQAPAISTPDAEVIIMHFTCIQCPVTVPLTGTNAILAFASAQVANGSVQCIDNQAPTANCVGSLTVNLSSGAVTPAQLNNGSTDPDGDTLTFTINDGNTGGQASYALSCADVTGSPITLTLEVSDGSLTDTCAVQVTVVDDIDPTVVTQNATINLDANGNATLTAAQVDNGSSDTCGAVTLSVAPSTFDCADLGQNTVTLTVTDAAGNSATGTATVTVADVTAPNATADAGITLQLGANGQATLTTAAINAQAADNCSATVSLSKTSFNCSNLGSNTVTVNATDTAGNTDPSPATVTVNVVDNIAPTATAQNVQVSLDQYGVATVTAAQVNNGSTDNCGTPTLALDVTDFDCSNVGANPVVLTVTDSSNNTATASAVVTVVDDILPTLDIVDGPISLVLDATGNATLTAGEVYVGASDNCGVDINTLAISPATFTCADIGTNTVTVTIQDNSGNTSASQTVTVNVSDTTAPNAVAQDITVELDANGAGVITANQVNNGSSDNCGIASQTLDIVTFDCGDVGTPVTVTLTVTDAQGLSDTATATVTVIDTIDPVINANATATVNLDANGVATIDETDISSSITDNCGVASVVLDRTTFNCADANTTVPVLITATDTSGNVQTATVNVTVTDTNGACVVEEGEGTEECGDFDNNGLIDDPENCLELGVVQGSTNVGVEGGCLLETRQVLFSNTDGTGTTTLVVPDPNNFEVTVTVTIPNSSIPQGESAVLAVKVSCDIDNLLSGDATADVLEANLEPDGVPVEEIIPGTYVLATVFQSAGGALTEVQGVTATITYTGLDVNTVEEPTVYQHGTSVVDNGTGPATIGDVTSGWAESANTTRTGATVTVTTNGLSVFVVTQPAPQVPFLAIRPNPAFTRVVGIVPVGQTRTVEFTLRNSGPGIVAGAATVTGTGFSIEGDATYTLGGASTDTVRVRFAPTLAVPYTGSITFTGGTNGPVTVQLSGVGTTNAAKTGFFGCGTTDGGGLGFGDLAVVGLLLSGLLAGSRVWGRARQS